MSTKRTAPGTWYSDGEVITADQYAQLFDALGDPEMRPVNMKFIVLADHHFDAMEKALRTAQAAICLYHCFATGDNKKDDSPPTKHIRACKQALDVLAAIDKERATHD